tara:strand:- start:2497 stop:3756 length:1260 start_codon:yes stop_codon:yes gene_type:complete
MPVSTTSALNLTEVTEALKEHYKPLTIKDMVYRDNPLLALMPKYERFGGENMPIPLQYGIANRRSATFSDAQGLNSATRLERFVVTRVRDYSFARITGETIQATEGNADAFLKYATMEIDGAIKSLTRSLAVAMYGDGSGKLGDIKTGGLSANTNGTGRTIELENAESVTNFEVGMTLKFVQSLAHAPRAATFEITSVDRDTGILTGTIANSANAAADTDFLVQLGDYTHAGGDANGNPLKLAGLESWIPAGTPANLFGVTRTTDRTRLAGVPFDGSSQPIEEALTGAASRLAREGGSPDVCLMDFTQFNNLEKALGSKVVYDKVSSDDADIGFQALTIIGPKGPIKIVADQNCTPNVAYMLQMDTWTLNSLGPAPKILDLDGNRMLRIHNDDAYELRVGFYGNVACTAPGYNSRIALA